MKFNVGDKVKFLNEKGGGVVARIIDKTMVEVAIQEGFDIPVSVKELILTEPAAVAECQNDGNVDSTELNSNVKIPYDSNYKKAVFFAFLPHNQEVLISGLADVIIVNNSPFDVLFNLYKYSKGNYEGVNFGSVASRSQAVVDYQNIEDVHDWEEIIIQMLFYSDDDDKLLPPAINRFRIKHSRVLAKSNFVDSPFFQGQKAFIFPIFECKDENYAALNEIVEISGKVKPFTEKSLINKYLINNELAEVDLHIEALVENPSQYNASRILSLQLDYFTACLESAIESKIRKVVFIHGVGVGILKIELKKILDEYDFIEYYDASIAKYGIGATEVLISKK